MFRAAIAFLFTAWVATTHAESAQCLYASGENDLAKVSCKFEDSYDPISTKNQITKSVTLKNKNFNVMFKVSADDALWRGIGELNEKSAQYFVLDKKQKLVRDNNFEWQCVRVEYPEETLCLKYNSDDWDNPDLFNVDAYCLYSKDGKKVNRKQCNIQRLSLGPKFFLDQITFDNKTFVVNESWFGGETSAAMKTLGAEQEAEVILLNDRFQEVFEDEKWRCFWGKENPELVCEPSITEIGKIQAKQSQSVVSKECKDIIRTGFYAMMLSLQCDNVLEYLDSNPKYMENLGDKGKKICPEPPSIDSVEELDDVKDRKKSAKTHDEFCKRELQYLKEQLKKHQN